MKTYKPTDGKMLIRLRTSAAFLTMTIFPLVIASWLGAAAVAIAVWGTTVGAGDVTAGCATVAFAVACGAPDSCTRLPFMLSTATEPH